MIGSGAERRAGAVRFFDAQVGLGAIAADDGADVSFHCIAIADGTRSIEAGTRITFVSLPKLGRLEATDIRPA